MRQQKEMYEAVYDCPYIGELLEMADIDMKELVIALFETDYETLSNISRKINNKYESLFDEGEDWTFDSDFTDDELKDSWRI